MANQSTIGAVGPFALLSNMILARFYLNENIRKWEYISISLLIPGVVITLSYASMENKRYTYKEFNDLFFSTFSMGYLIMNLIFIIFLVFISNIILQIHPAAGRTASHDKLELEEVNYQLEKDIPEYSKKNDSEYDTEETQILHRSVTTINESSTKMHNSKSAQYFPAKSFTTVVSLSMSEFFHSPRWRVIPLIAFPYASCFSTSLSMTFSRCVAGFAMTENGDFSEFPISVYITYVVLIGLCWVGSYIFLNKSLKYFNTVYVVPLFKAGDLFHNLLSGGIFLREFGGYEGYDLFMFLTGIIIWAGSIFMLLMGNDRNEQETTEA